MEDHGATRRAFPPTSRPSSPAWSRPGRVVDGVVRWRRVDLQRVIRERFGVSYHERTVGKVPKALGFAHLSPRPRHPDQDPHTIEVFRQTGAQR